MKANSEANSSLDFSHGAPVASHGLGGLVRDHFGHGRLYATVCAHGGLTDISYWGRQHLGAAGFFQGDPQSAWVKLFRVYAGIDGERQYLPLNNTTLHAFGYTSRANVGGVAFNHDLLLLPDALVQRFRVTDNPQKRSVRIESLHQEACTAAAKANRTWGEFKFVPALNALVTSCTDLNPHVLTDDKSSLAVSGLPMSVKDSPKAVTWIGIGCDSRLGHHRGYHARSKHYLKGSALKGDQAALFLVFAHSRKELATRLKTLSKTVHRECDALLDGYANRLKARPQIDTGDTLLNSAFSQYPEAIQQMKVPDFPGAIRATLAGYFIWGWDCMTAPISSALANEPEDAAQTLRFMQKILNKKAGIPHTFTTSAKLYYKSPYPAQCQFIADLYHIVSTTGDLSLARELMPTCRFLLDRCRERKVKDTGLVEGYALWPDFPEAMEETGRDISSMNNSLLYQGLRAVEYMAAALGDTGLALDCREWAQTMRASFVRYLYDPEKGFFISSCDSRTIKPRKHYCPQSIFWLTPFARELVAHDAHRITAFLNHELRSDKCLLTLPHWDKAWMADGNQLGSSFPAADHFYINAQKLTGNAAGLEHWLSDVDWFWRRHTAPEAFTPEAGNEADFGADNPGCKQLQACTTWYAGVYSGLAGMDFDHEGLTLTPFGHRPLSIQGLQLRNRTWDITVKGSGNHVGSLTLNGKKLPAGTRKLAWASCTAKKLRLELIRSTEAPDHPVIVRADGLQIDGVRTETGSLFARIDGTISGEVVVQAPKNARCTLDGKPTKFAHDASTGTLTIPFLPGRPVNLIITIQ